MILRILRVILFAIVGTFLGAVAGFGGALIAMSLGPNRYDGSYGMREMLLCLPTGTLIGLVAGIWIGLRRSSG